jgi:hypothetical protein
MKTPKITFTKSQLMEKRPCADGLAFAKSCDFDFHKIYETCPRGDWLIWLLRRSAMPTKEQSVKIACEIALQVLPILEKKYPDEKRPRKAIEAALAWLSNPTDENKALASAARCEASKAAQEIRSAWYSAAAAAAAAAADAAAAARKAMHLTAANIIREIVKNPFKKGSK